MKLKDFYSAIFDHCQDGMVRLEKRLIDIIRMISINKVMTVLEY